MWCPVPRAILASRCSVAALWSVVFLERSLMWSRGGGDWVKAVYLAHKIVKVSAASFPFFLRVQDGMSASQSKPPPLKKHTRDHGSFCFVVIRKPHTCNRQRTVLYICCWMSVSHVNSPKKKKKKLQEVVPIWMAVESLIHILSCLNIFPSSYCWKKILNSVESEGLVVLYYLSLKCSILISSACHK